MNSTTNMLEEIAQIEKTADCLYSEDAVEQAITSMAAEITTLLSERNPVMLCAMNGGIVIAGKLLTQLKFPVAIDAINVSRYRNATRGGELKWLLHPSTELTGRTVLIVDDILDEGYTLQALINYCRDQGASSVYSAVLVDKQLPQSKPVTADFVGLETPDRYLFGYGMDYKGYLRNAAGIYACKVQS